MTPVAAVAIQRAEAAVLAHFRQFPGAHIVIRGAEEAECPPATHCR
jgi:hypothetical protein